MEQISSQPMNPRRFLLPIMGLLGFGSLTQLSCSKAPKLPPIPIEPPPIPKPVEIRFPQAPEYRFEQRAIELRITADPLLNIYESKPHTLLLVVYQLSDVNAFNEQTKSREGLQSLLNAKIFDPSVTSVDRLFVQPGESRTTTFNRAQNAKWVAFVAGYYQLVPGAVHRLIPVPLVGQNSIVGHLQIEVVCGPNAIIDVFSSKWLR